MSDEYLPTRTCAECGADISHRWHTARYCSLKCTQAKTQRRNVQTETPPANTQQKGTEI